MPKGQDAPGASRDGAGASQDAPGWREEPRPGERREDALRRLRIRCWRRGSREMDLLLGGFIDAAGADLSAEELAAFDALCREDDATLYRWIAGGAQAPAAHRAIVERVRAHHRVD